MLEMPREGADSAGGPQSSVVTPMGTELYQAAQVRQHAELATLLLLPALCRAKMHLVLPTGLTYPNDLILVLLRLEFSLLQTV